MKGKEYFISGIDTDCGKTYITGLLGYHIKQKTEKIITSKHIQTGCKGISEDIMEHRRIMESELLPEDKSGLTCPYVFSYPASPHLAMQIDEKKIDLNIIRKSNKQLLQKFDIVLTEGAGGLMVPITEGYHAIDYIKEHALPLIFVSSSKLGSINHTLLSLEAIRLKNIELRTFIYNHFPDSDRIISEDSFTLFKTYLSKGFPETKIIHCNELEKGEPSSVVDFLL